MASDLFSVSKFILGFALMGVLMAGCESEPETKDPFYNLTIATAPPPFLVGPAAALLISTNGFITSLTLESPTIPNNLHSISGQLLCQGSRLLFAPTQGDQFFIWDVQQHRGFIMSAALQGYAPISSPLKITNVIATPQAVPLSRKRVNGHPSHEIEVAVASNDGTSAPFAVWCATDLDDFPIRITSLNAAEPLNLNLYNVKTEALAAKLFLPPEDFTKYDSPEAMNGELAMRKSKLKIKYTEHPRDEIPMPKPGIR